MFAQYFGHFLLDSGYITVEQLKYVLDHEKETRVKLGHSAIHAGYMTPEQVKLVHNEQLKVDKKFGQIALELGFLTQYQLNELVKNQKKGHYILSQCLIEQKFMTFIDLQDAMTKYAQKYQLNANILEETEEYKTIYNFFSFECTLWDRIYSEYTSLLIRNCIRFIDEVPILSIERIDDFLEKSWCVSQEIKGKFNMTTSMSASDEKSLIKLAALFNKEEYTDFDIYVQDTLSEMLNLHNGIFLVNMSNLGLPLDMLPQQVNLRKNFPSGSEVFKIKLSWIWGNIDIIIY